MNDQNYIYLDNAATTPMDPVVIKEINHHYKMTYGNASSLHKKGIEAHQVLESSREKIASIINAAPEDIIFTSSGTESDNLAIKGVARKNKDKGNHIITSSIEHHAVENPCKELEKEGFEVTFLPVNEYGRIDLEILQNAIKDSTILISIMFANNEIGTIQPIEEIGQLAKDHDIIFHTDAVQAFGKVPIDVEKMSVDLLSASAHKIYGPKGVGMLYTRNKGSRKGWGKCIEPILHGGGHEQNLRPSTENVPGIAGFAKAAELAQNEIKSESKRESKLRDRIIEDVLKIIADTKLNGHPTMRLPNNVNLAFKYIEGESIVLSLDLEGIATSTGSACSSKSLEPSHVLKAIDLPREFMQGSLRVSLGRFTTEDHINYFLEKLPPIIEKLRKMSPLKNPT
ncbi:MAG: cysteine desulfurase (tRNA sulfurtransferase), PLP-dependent [Promethearchaeota archaeon]|nr:MAG: cysteine desulfurase (tRNA sulfurtransferase), PLP-dependent [Candidatus Lokiarchaeota archaeon]